MRDVDKRISKFNKGIDSFKKLVMNLAKYGNDKELSRENNIYENNLLSQRKIDALVKEKILFVNKSSD